MCYFSERPEALLVLNVAEPEAADVGDGCMPEEVVFDDFTPGFLRQRMLAAGRNHIDDFAEYPYEGPYAHGRDLWVDLQQLDLALRAAAEDSAARAA